MSLEHRSVARALFMTTLFAGTVLAGGSSFAAPTGRVQVPGGTLPSLPINGGGSAPAQPATIGWPHSIITGTGNGCMRNPGPNEVIVWKDGNFSGACAALTAGFYPYATNFLVGNDAISSIKVGSAVRARVFKDAGYAGGWAIEEPGSVMAGIGSWNDVISSMRVEPANRSETCNDVHEGEIALYENVAYAGDCVVLPGDTSYASADIMGIANDTISSMHNNGTHTLMGFWDASFNRAGYQLNAHTSIIALPGGSSFTTGINDNISSIQMQ